MSNRLYVGTRKGLFTLTRASASETGPWSISKPAFLGDQVPMVLPDPRDGFVYAALSLDHFGAKLHRSADGNEWEEVSAPAYPHMPEAPRGAESQNGETPPPSVELIWSLEAGGSNEPGRLWAGTIPGGLFRSGDSGNSWDLVRSLWDRPERNEWFGGGYEHHGIHSISLDPRDSRNITVGVSCGGVWVTHDGGENWECRAKGMWANYMPPERRDDPLIQDPHRIARCLSSPDTLWASHHNAVFRTTDGMANWNEVTAIRPSSFGFAVAAHPSDPETAWFVPAISDERRVPVDGKLVVARTSDGGETFEILRNGFPQSPAYDLVYRHGLDVDATGNCLALGSTTGSLWISDDGGTSWQQISGHFPPIFCVRFAG